MSKAASASYNNPCVVCFAKPFQPCRTIKTGRITDTHLRRANGEWPVPTSRVGEWGGD